MTSGSARIMVVDDDAFVREVVGDYLRSRDYAVACAGTGEEAMRRLGDAWDVVLLDWSLPDIDGLQVLSRAVQAHPVSRVVMLTGHQDIDSVVQAMRAGAWDYVAKPFDLDRVADAVARAVHKRTDGKEIEVPEHPALARIIGRCPAVVRAKSLIARISESPAATVLITGESGTGKDLAAHAVHACSARASGPFVNVTCSALPGALLESELFGHERGAFTDAKQRKIGLVEQADGGTLFLDEVGEMEPMLQSKLLRFLEERAFRRVGGNTDLRADVRIVAATNVDLAAAVAQRRFREDLYYRLAVLMVHLPALRERPGDIPLLTRSFLDASAARLGRAPAHLSASALRAFERHTWPGNVRELKNTIERAEVLRRGEVLDAADVEFTPMGEPNFRSAIELPAGGLDLGELERSLVCQALSRCRGNVTRAARLLGLNRDQVRYRVAKFGLRQDVHAERTA